MATAYKKAAKVDQAKADKLAAQLRDHMAYAAENSGTLEDIQLLVQTLDGEYTYFEPLWHQATAEHTDPEPTPEPQPPSQGTTSRLEELITAFNNILATTTNRPTTQRRPLPTPSRAPPPGPANRPPPPARTDEPTPTGPSHPSAQRRQRHRMHMQQLIGR